MDAGMLQSFAMLRPRISVFPGHAPTKPSTLRPCLTRFSRPASIPTETAR
jgi:hypothetical protein